MPTTVEVILLDEASTWLAILDRERESKVKDLTPTTSRPLNQSSDSIELQYLAY
jgi:hypothetical protein